MVCCSLALFQSSSSPGQQGQSVNTSFGTRFLFLAGPADPLNILCRSSLSCLTSSLKLFTVFCSSPNLVDRIFLVLKALKRNNLFRSSLQFLLNRVQLPLQV